METTNYIFTPAAGAPSAKKIQKVTYQFLIVITVAAIVALFSRHDFIGYGYIAFIWFLVCAAVLLIIRTNIYVIEIQINSDQGILYFSCMNYKGAIKYKKINIKNAKYSFKPNASNLYPRLTLTIQDSEARLQIRETKSDNKDHVNVFYRDKMNEMNQLIMQIKERKVS